MATATSKSASTTTASTTTSAPAFFADLPNMTEFGEVKAAGMKAVKALRKMGEGDRFVIAGIETGEAKARAFVGRVLDTESGGFAGGRVIEVKGGEILASKDMGAAVLHLRKSGKTFTILGAQRLKKGEYKDAAKAAKAEGMLLGGKPEKKDKKKKSKKPEAAARGK